MITHLLDPLRATRNGFPVLIVAWTTATTTAGSLSQTEILALFVDGEGALDAHPIKEFNIDWRYEAKTDQWVDADLGAIEDGN
jgi:hypothetical protein